MQLTELERSSFEERPRTPYETGAMILQAGILNEFLAFTLGRTRLMEPRFLNSPGWREALRLPGVVRLLERLGPLQSIRDLPEYMGTFIAMVQPPEEDADVQELGACIRRAEDACGLSHPMGVGFVAVYVSALSPLRSSDELLAP